MVLRGNVKVVKVAVAVVAEDAVEAVPAKNKPYFFPYSYV